MRAVLRWIAFPFTLSVLSCATGRHQDTPGNLPSITIGDATFARRLLPNGLRAAAVRDSEKGVSVFMVVGVGNRQETAGTTGIAHLTEHAMYTGTATTGADEHDRLVNEMGGQSNAYTRNDYTLYYDHEIPVEKLSDVLRMEADRLRGLTFDEAAVLHERDRLIDEEANTFQSEMAREELLESVVFRRHPYGVGVLDENGHTKAGKLGIPLIRSFYDMFYHPDNTSVVVAGDVDPQVALDAIEQAFRALPRGPERPAPIQEPDSQAREEQLVTDLPRDRCEFVWMGPDAEHEDRPALDVLAKILDRKRISDRSAVTASMGGRVDRDLFRVAATGDKADQELEAILGPLNNAEWTDSEIDEAKELIRDRFTSLSIRGRPYFSLAALFGVYEVHGLIDRLAKYPQQIDQVSRSDLKRVARQHLSPEQRVTVWFAASGSSRGPLPDDPHELSDVAQSASSGGDYDRAIAAYTKLLEGKPNRMNTVIYLASRGQVRMDQADYAGAIQDFEQALEVVDYPAVRELLEEARSLQSGDASAVTRRSEAKKAKKKELPERLADAMEELSAWRELEFLRVVEPEIVPKSDETGKLAGWYEPDQERLVVVDGKSAAFSRGTLLHELHHALQDQHFDLSRLHDEADALGPDAARGLVGVIEGEAMMAVSDLMDYDFEQHAGIPEAGEKDRSRFEKIYQYGAGLRFIRALHESGGWEAVSNAFRKPPRTSAEIYHPDRYPAPAPIPPELAVEGTVLTSEQRGEFELRWLLVQEPATRAAMDGIASNLTGDRYRTVEVDEDAPLEVWDLAFTHESVASELEHLAITLKESQGWACERHGKVIRLSRRLMEQGGEGS